MRIVAMFFGFHLAAFAAMVVELPSPQPVEMPFPEASTNVVLAPLPPNLRTAAFTIEPQPSRTNEYAVVFENAYTNAPGDVVGRRSTTVSLEGRVTGGQYGGTLTVMLSDGGRLLRTYENLPAARTIAPGETYSFSVGYEAQHESAAENDITATATFTENMTGRVVSDIASITAVRVELTPDVVREGALH